VGTKRLPEVIEPGALCRSGGALSGRLALQTMARLREEFGEQAGSAELELRFAMDETGAPVATGHISAAVNLVCNRCLEPLLAAVECPVAVCFIAADAEHEHEARYEPMPVPQEGVALARWIEDEILLSLPLVPRHERARCPAPAGGRREDREAGGSRRPFAQLAGLRERLKHRRDN